MTDQMSDLSIRTDGQAGRITLTRERALNALSYPMCLDIERALDTWREDPAVAAIVIDSLGERAFCAGGDITDLYRHGMAGNYSYGQTFWRDEYRLNAKLARYPKPIISLMQGFTMGGGVGLGCHVRHRVVCDTTQISMPECSLGLVPDVGGSLLLARAPGRLGEYLALTAARMGPGDAIHAGFADHYIPRNQWPDLVREICESGGVGSIAQLSRPSPDSPLAVQQAEIDALFSGTTLSQVIVDLQGSGSAIAGKSLQTMDRNSPLAMTLTLTMLARLRAPGQTIKTALEQEYRVAHRIMEHGDFLEGIRAAVIDKDRTPKWKHGLTDVPEHLAAEMLAPLGPHALDLGDI